MYSVLASSRNPQRWWLPGAWTLAAVRKDCNSCLLSYFPSWFRSWVLSRARKCAWGLDVGVVDAALPWSCVAFDPAFQLHVLHMLVHFYSRLWSWRFRSHSYEQYLILGSLILAQTAARLVLMAQWSYTLRDVCYCSNWSSMLHLLLLAFHFI